MSITHHHICAVINSELRSRQAWSGGTPIRILDAGFGNGRMAGLLQVKLSELNPELTFEIHGFDVSDSGVQPDGFVDASLRRLKDTAPGVDWASRLSIIGSREPWPYSDGSFHFVVSNQVMEHVVDHDQMLGQIRRVLRDDGVSVHLFPLASYLLEGHLKLPFLHWIHNSDLLEAYLRSCSRMGIGIYRGGGGEVARPSIEEFSRVHADYIDFETNYLTLRELYRLTKRNRFRASFRYTSDFYKNKLRQVLGRPLRYLYPERRAQLFERLLFGILARISSVTLVLEKGNRYSAGWADTERRECDGPPLSISSSKAGRGQASAEMAP